MERRKKENPLNYLKQHRKQLEASTVDKIIRALFWGNRVGKTDWGGQETARFFCKTEPIYTDVYKPGGDDTPIFIYKELLPSFRPHYPVNGWVGSPSFDLQRDGPQKKLEAYIPPKEIDHIEYLRSNIWKEVTLKDGSKLGFKSYEQSREKWQSAGMDWIWFDEEPPYDIWEEASVREEAGHTLRIIITMTAIKGMTWVYDKLYSNTGNRDIFISEAGWDDNPWLTEKQKSRMGSNLTPEALKVRREGKFVKRVGLICNWFTRTTHVKHYAELDKSWDWYRVCDGGFSDPFAYLLIGIDHQGDINIVKGFREPGLLTKDIKERIARVESGLTIINGISDNDNPRLLEELRQKSEDDPISINFNPIEKVSGDAKSWDEFLAEKLHEYGHIQKGTGRPRLYISDSLVRYDEKKEENVNWLQQEIESLTWTEVKNAEGSEIRPKWDDHRRFGHHFDGTRCLAYFCAGYMKQPKVDNNNLPQYQPSVDDDLGM